MIPLQYSSFLVVTNGYCTKLIFYSFTTVDSPHNGMYKGRRYFHCPRGHGAMVKYSQVTRINPPEKRPPMSGNEMFPSWSEVQKRRKEVKEKFK